MLLVIYCEYELGHQPVVNPIRLSLTFHVTFLFSNHHDFKLLKFYLMIADLLYQWIYPHPWKSAQHFDWSIKWTTVQFLISTPELQSVPSMSWWDSLPPGWYPSYVYSSSGCAGILRWLLVHTSRLGFPAPADKQIGTWLEPGGSERSLVRAMLATSHPCAIWAKKILFFITYTTRWCGLSWCNI